MEVFLCDTIVKYVMSEEAHKQHFVQTYDPLATQNFPMKAIYAKYKTLDKIIKDSLSAIVYHDLELVSKLYKKNTGVDVNPNDIIREAIKIRHDIVHRNGKDKEGNPYSNYALSVKVPASKTDGVIEYETVDVTTDESGKGNRRYSVPYRSDCHRRPVYQ